MRAAHAIAGSIDIRSTLPLNRDDRHAAHNALRFRRHRSMKRLTFNEIDRVPRSRQSHAKRCIER